MEEYRKDEDLIRGKQHDDAKPKSGLAKVLEQAKYMAAQAEQYTAVDDDQTGDEGKNDGSHEAGSSNPGSERIGLAGAAGLVRNFLEKKE